MDSNDELNAKLRARLAEAIAAAPELTEVMRGTVGERFVRCGKKGCHCQEGKGHGPVFFLSVSLGRGRTKQITLSGETYELARQYVANYGRLREIIEEISGINRERLQLSRSKTRKDGKTSVL